MTEYEKAMLRLKLLEITQRQALIAMTAMAVRSPQATQLALEGEEMLDKAITSVRKLL
jgi:hypothetical protein